MTSEILAAAGFMRGAHQKFVNKEILFFGNRSEAERDAALMEGLTAALAQLLPVLERNG